MLVSFMQVVEASDCFGKLAAEAVYTAVNLELEKLGHTYMKISCQQMELM